MKRGIGIAAAIAAMVCAALAGAAWADGAARDSAAVDTTAAKSVTGAADHGAAKPPARTAAPLEPRHGKASKPAADPHAAPAKPKSPHNWNVAPLPPSPPTAADSNRVPLPKRRVRTTVAADSPGHKSKVSFLTLQATHRVFGAFKDTERVRMKEEFRVGDSDYSARAIDFEPDFTMGLQTGRVFSRSSEPNNPAVRLIVKQKGVAQDTVWAFLNSPPHFARKSLLAFRLMRVEFLDRAPVPAPTPAPDSAAAGGKGK